MREAAKRRLEQGVPTMLGRLAQLTDPRYRLADGSPVPSAVRLAAIRDWLDRAGVDRKLSLEITAQPWEEMIRGVVAEVAEDGLEREIRVIDAVVADHDDDRMPALPPGEPAPRPAPRNGTGRRRRARAAR